MMSLVVSVMIFGAVVAAISLLELRWAASHAQTNRWINFYAFLLTSGVTMFLLPLVSLNPVASRYALVDLAHWPLVGAAIAYVVLMDFFEWAYHVAQHHIPWLWRIHSLHHSDPNMNTTTAARHFWADPVVKSVTIWPACALILKPTPTVLMIYWVISLYHFFVHANLKVSFGRWSWLLNHPAYHRRHHSSEPAHFNSNYASLFPLFDRLCGFYNRPDGFPPTGLERHPRTLVDVAIWPLKR